jgi:hypothetical protein
MYNSTFSMRRCPHIGEAEASSICANPARGGRASHLEPGGEERDWAEALFIRLDPYIFKQATYPTPPSKTKPKHTTESSKTNQ